LELKHKKEFLEETHRRIEELLDRFKIMKSWESNEELKEDIGTFIVLAELLLEKYEDFLDRAL